MHMCRCRDLLVELLAENQVVTHGMITSSKFAKTVVEEQRERVAALLVLGGAEGSQTMGFQPLSKKKSWRRLWKKPQ
jgi:ribosomal protein S17